ncbi:MAG: hypothetical protein JXA97_12485 [Anaerolineales bacterium]|nr:hypothetical protein [Anaerolineales bacterium]
MPRSERDYEVTEPRPELMPPSAGRILLAVFVCVLLAIVLLVLTGIIAEPETLIEQILRAVAG